MNQNLKVVFVNNLDMQVFEEQFYLALLEQIKRLKIGQLGF